MSDSNERSCWEMGALLRAEQQSLGFNLDRSGSDSGGVLTLSAGSHANNDAPATGAFSLASSSTTVAQVLEQLLAVTPTTTEHGI